jgi:hypothetical protein
MAKVAKRSQVADDGEVPEMPQQLAPECRPLLAGLVHAGTAGTMRDALESAPEAYSGHFGNRRRASSTWELHTTGGIASGAGRQDVSGMLRYIPFQHLSRIGKRKMRAAGEIMKPR